MDEKHHVYPKFLLERFSSDGRVLLHDRQLRVALPTSVDRAAKVGGYYSITEPVEVPADTLADALENLASNPGIRDSLVEVQGNRAFLKPGAIEAFLSHMESRAAPDIERLAIDGPPAVGSDREVERFNIASLVALQAVRGEWFRHQFDQIARAFMREQIIADPELATARWRKQEKRRGSKPVADPVQHLLDGLADVRISTINKLGEMLPLAIHGMAPHLFAMTWRVLRYGEPNVVGSDEGVGLWARPGRDLIEKPLAIATADAVYFPIGARHILQMTSSSMAEELVHGHPAKLRQSNNAVASAAHRWIFTHPDNTVIADLHVQPWKGFRRDSFPLPPRAPGERRELVRFTQAPE
jgi:hypothetical protein